MAEINEEYEPTVSNEPMVPIVGGQATSKVYVKTNSNNLIVDIGSNISILDTTGYIKIDEGTGEKYSYAQCDYLDKPLVDKNNCQNYKLVDGKVVERTDEEKQTDTAYIEKIRFGKYTEIEALKETKTVVGIDIDVLGRGSLHYDLTKENQDYMEQFKSSIAAGAAQVLWHDSSKLMHEVYTAEQFTMLYKAARKHVVSCQVRCEGLKQYISNILNGTETDRASMASAVTWDTTLPTDIQTVVDQQITLLSGE